MDPLIKDHVLAYFDCFLIDKTCLMYGIKENQCIWGENLQDSLEILQKASRIFLHPNAFSNWSEFLLDSTLSLQNLKIICICQSDLCFSTEQIAPLRQAFPTLQFWIQNWCGDVSGCELFPIGINFYGIKSIETPVKKTNLSITFVTPNSFDRMEFHTFLYETPQLAPYCLPFLERDEYCIALSEALFVVCPCGNGFDTYRFWECLAYKTIPIVKENTFFKVLRKQYPALPFVLIEKWEHLLERISMLTIEYYETLWSNADISVSTDKYWIEKLLH